MKYVAAVIMLVVVVAVGVVGVIMLMQSGKPVRVAGVGTEPTTAAEPVVSDVVKSEAYAAALNGELQKVEELLDGNPGLLDAGLNDAGERLLHVAAVNRRLPVVQELLRRGADVNARTAKGYTPLYVCVQHGGEANQVKTLIEGGADFNLPDNEGKTPLRMARELKRGGMTTLLRQRGARE